MDDFDWCEYSFESIMEMWTWDSGFHLLKEYRRNGLKRNNSVVLLIQQGYGDL